MGNTIILTLELTKVEHVLRLDAFARHGKRGTLNRILIEGVTPDGAEWFGYTPGVVVVSPGETYPSFGKGWSTAWTWFNEDLEPMVEVGDVVEVRCKTAPTTDGTNRMRSIKNITKEDNGGK